MQKNPKEGSYAPAFEQSRKRLQQISPDLIAKLTLLQFDSGRNCFTFDSFGQRIEITYPDGRVCFKGTDEKLQSFVWELILLNYLTCAKAKPLNNEWVSYRDLPQGNVFYPNIKANVLEDLARFFADCDKTLLKTALSKLGFTSAATKADLAAIVNFSPRVPVLIQFWEGEEDIQSSCQLLFDSSISDQMHIEDVAALCSLIKELILKQYDFGASV